MGFHTVKIKKYSDVIEEFVANATLYPGMLIELISTGKVQKHASEDGNVFPMFALEDEMQGKGIVDAYAAADVVQCWIPYRGDIVYGLLEDGQSVLIGDELTSAGNGYLKKYVPTDDSTFVQHPLQIVGWAAETLDLTGSSGEESGPQVDFNRFFKVRIA